MTPQILLVEDDPDISKIISMVITMAGYKVTLATNGAEGLKLAAQQHFDLIITDYMMPIMDGNQFVKELSKHPAPPPVIILTAAIDAIEPNPLIKKMIIKPVPLKELINHITSALK